MQILPTPPTDNIYKFCAIAGLWMFTGLTLLIAWFIFWSFQNEIEFKHSQAYFYSKNMIIEMTNRLNSIDNMKIDENKLSWVPPKLSIDEEKKFLSIAIKNHNKTIEKFKLDAEKEHNDFIKFIGENNVIALFIVYYALTFFFLIYGFYMWITRIERPSLKSISLDVKIKELTIVKLEKEMNKTSTDEVKDWQTQSD